MNGRPLVVTPGVNVLGNVFETARQRFQWQPTATQHDPDNVLPLNTTADELGTFAQATYDARAQLPVTIGP